MKKLILPLLLAVLLAGCGQKPADKTDFTLLAECTADSIVFPGVTWGMSKADALKALKLDESMLTAVEFSEGTKSFSDMYEVNEPANAGLPNILTVSFSRDEEMVNPDSLIGVTVGYTDKAELEKTIENFNALYGDANIERLNVKKDLLGSWCGTLTTLTRLDKRAEEFASAYNNVLQVNAASKDITDGAIAAPSTSASVLIHASPDADGIVGYIELFGLWDARVNQFLSK